MKKTSGFAKAKAMKAILRSMPSSQAAATLGLATTMADKAVTRGRIDSNMAEKSLQAGLSGASRSRRRT